MIVTAPTVGDWYRRPNGTLFEVVALDEEFETVEMQFFDGTIDEVDFETWPSLLTQRVNPPEDWLGSVDMDPEDFTGRDDGIPQGWHDPIEILERSDKGTLP